MEFIINGEAADVSFDSEKNAADIVESFSKQIEEGRMIASFEVNGKYYSTDDPALKELSIDSIEKIEIEVASQEDVAVSLLDEAKRILLAIAEDLRKNGYSGSDKYYELFDWIIETIGVINRLAVFEMTEVKLLNMTIGQVETYLKNPAREESKIDQLAGILENLVQYLDSIQLKIVSRFNIAKEDLLEAIDNGLELLPEISEGFQLGKDKEALSKVHVIIDLLESCTIYLKKNLADLKAKEDNADSMYEEMNSLLGEIVDAFEKGDFILIGDLMEYELTERLEKYKSLIE